MNGGSCRKQNSEGAGQQVEADLSSLSLNAYFPYLLNRIANRLNISFRERLRAVGITVPRWRVLMVLMEQDGLSIGRLADFTVTEQAALSRILDQMERDDLVVRRSSQRDSRVVEIYPTDHGREIFRRMAPASLEHGVRSTSSLNTEERSVLLRLLTRVMDDLCDPATARNDSAAAMPMPSYELPTPLQPSRDLFFDDIAIGQVFEAPAIGVSEDEIVGFAKQFDPQYYHVDPVAAQTSEFGGLIASGFHTLSISFREFFKLNLWEQAVIGSPGMRDLRWMRPVRPGDSLAVSAEVIDCRRSSSKPDRGVVTMRHQTFNQDNVLVLRVECLHMLRSREAVAGQGRNA